jgi:hypothetical protein
MPMRCFSNMDCAAAIAEAGQRIVRRHKSRDFLPKHLRALEHQQRMIAHCCAYVAVPVLLSKIDSCAADRAVITTSIEFAELSNRNAS